MHLLILCMVHLILLKSCIRTVLLLFISKITIYFLIYNRLEAEKLYYAIWCVICYFFAYYHYSALTMIFSILGIVLLFVDLSVPFILILPVFLYKYYIHSIVHHLMSVFQFTKLFVSVNLKLKSLVSVNFGTKV